MKFGAHFLPTYVPELDGPVTEFYRRIFDQIEVLERLWIQPCLGDRASLRRLWRFVTAPADFLVSGCLQDFPHSFGRGRERIAAA